MAEKARPGSNGFDPEVVKNAVDRVENIEAEMLKEKMAWMSKCKAHKSDINLVLDEAKEKGVPKKELKSVLKARELEAKAQAARDNLEPDEQDTHDQIRFALGDLDQTPLGDAALANSNGADIEAPAPA